ncbi:MAG: phosphoribosylformylglycinamidine synthase subunit PurQ [Aerococcus sp.]|nr:phosphoribosylformylglycinamidine synthase subunit PurQ [Aerococcus sp.]
MHQFVIVPAEDSTFYLKEAHQFLHLDRLTAVKQYDIFEYEADTLNEAALQVFPNYEVTDDLEALAQPNSFRYRQILGQYDEVEEMTGRLVHDILQQTTTFHHSRVLRLEGLDQEETEAFKRYFVNETEIELVPFSALDYDMGQSDAKDLQQVQGFITFTDEQLADLIKDYSMDMADIRVVQAYFQAEGVNPTVFQLKVIDTYWSDHCRHTTFLTELTEITVEDGKYREAIEQAIAEYNDVRAHVYTDRHVKPVSLMDMGTINAKEAKRLGVLTNVDESDEVNACCIKIKVDVDGEEEDFLLYFKNETHNHPTEIEPFGGAATCIGGGIRDPLSGRSYVHQALRMVGAGNPTKAYEETRQDKLSQRVLAQRAVQGYSDYGNQIGQTAGYVKEFYHDGFEAKRMELGALVAAAPADAVVRQIPEPTDVVLLLGGPTGRDGLGAAVGSSMVQTEQSKELQGAEVQKGNPGIERKIIRLFRQPEATRLIKKCNDFGAGGVSVAIGELAPGLSIDLDQVPLKYAGMDPSEIALSESQERMAIVVAKSDVETFVSLAEAEDLMATPVATVTDSPYMVMNYKGEEVLRLRRDFLDSNGGKKTAQAHIISNDFEAERRDDRPIKEQLGDVKYASQKAIGQNFDFTIGKGTVLAPFGGKNQITEQEGMVAKIPVLGHETKSVSVMSGAFYPDIATQSPFHGAYYAVLASIAKTVGLGVPYPDVRLSFQEFFESLTSKEKWGKPTGALLGAFHALKQLDLASIGGKDSMSGTFEDLVVPPSLISFSVGKTTIDRVQSREFKATDSQIVLLKPDLTAEDLYLTDQLKEMFETVDALLKDNQVRAIGLTNDKTIEQNVVEMALGNGIGASIDQHYLHQKYPVAYLIETRKGLDVPMGEVIGETTATNEVVLDQTYALPELLATYAKPLADVFTDIPFEEKMPVAQPLEVPTITSDCRVLIVVTNGVNGEYDLKETFRQYTKQVDTFIIQEELDYKGSIARLKEKMMAYDILAFADGSIFSNRLFYGEGMSLILNDLKDALTIFMEKHYVLAVGAAMAGFVNNGWLEFGKAQPGTHLHYQNNPYDKYIATTVPVNVVKDSPFAPKGSYTTALSGYTLTLTSDDTVDLTDQILSRYATFIAGVDGIDAMVDPSGHLLGINSNTERFFAGGVKNVSVHESPLIANLVKVAKQTK